MGCGKQQGETEQISAQLLGSHGEAATKLSAIQMSTQWR